MEDFDKLRTVLARFAGLPKRRKTFMSVISSPRFEDSVSNVLAFLFGDDAHGTGNLWARSLMECADDSRSYECVSVEGVEREYLTPHGKRIDILITCDDCVIAIENKTGAGISNDFDEYARTVEQLAKDGRRAVKILLTLGDVDARDVPSGWAHVKYSELFAKVREHLGEYLEGANTDWMIFIRDFMYTVEILKGDSNTMDREAVDFVRGNYDNLKTLEKLRKDYIKEIRNMVSTLCERLNNNPHLHEVLSGKVQTSDIRFAYYSSGDWVSTYLDMPTHDNKTAVVDVCLDCEGWHITIWYRSEDEIVSVLQREQIGFVHEYGGRWSGKWVALARADFHEDIDSVCEKVINGVQAAMKIIYPQT